MLSKALCCYISYSFTQLLTTSLFTQDPTTCNCDHVTQTLSLDTLLKYKIGAIIAILVASAGGVAIPIVGKNFPILHPESKLFFLIKSFAAGVILSTGFVHILPDAFEDLSNHRLEHTPWGKFPFTGLAAMLGALGSLMIDAVATGHYRRAHFSASADEEASGEHAGHVHLHTHATHGHAHGPGTTDAVLDGLSDFDRIRYKITSQVLEMGIIVHSVIIGISLGTSQSLDTIKPLIIALCFHQFFEGIGLGGCIAQAAFKSGSTICMALFFSLTTPVGVAIGIGVTNVYDKHSPTALIVQGLLNSMAAGILIYMALVDLLAQDFMNSKVSSRQKETSSTSGRRESVETSLLLKHRAQEIVPKRILQMEEAIETKDFPSFARLACADSNQFHAVCLDTTPPIFYMNDTSHKIISIVEKWNRAETTPQVAYTFDAGPNAVLIARDRKAASQLLQRMLLYFPPSAGADLNSYVLGDKSILQDAGIKEMKDVESLPLPPELKDANSIQKYAGDVSYFICTKPGQGPVLLSDESQALLNPATGLPK